MEGVGVDDGGGCAFCVEGAGVGDGGDCAFGLGVGDDDVGEGFFFVECLGVEGVLGVDGALGV